VPILLQKSFWGAAQEFLEPLMRFLYRDVRGPYRFIQNRSRTSVAALKNDTAAEKPNFGELFWVVRFSTFATESANSDIYFGGIGGKSLALAGVGLTSRSAICPSFRRSP
jgi:hypothetical protein